MAHAIVTGAEASATRVNWRGAIIAGLIAGAAFMMMEMGLVAATGGSAWAPPRMIAAMVLGDGVLPPPATFDLGVLMAAMMIHFAMSIAYSAVLALLVSRVNATVAMIVGALFGLALYLVNFFVMTEFWPWFAMARNWVSVVSHIGFGAIAAIVYGRYRPRQTASW